jgi:hypothetical protein
VSKKAILKAGPLILQHALLQQPSPNTHMHTLNSPTGPGHHEQVVSAVLGSKWVLLTGLMEFNTLSLQERTVVQKMWPG